MNTTTDTRNDTTNTIRTHCTTITNGWNHMHQPLTTGSIAAPTTPNSGIGDEDSDADHGVTQTEATISDRAHITAILAAWARLIIDEWDVRKTVPLATDTPALATFINRWAWHLAGHDAAPDLIDELATCARTVNRRTHTQHRTRVALTTCTTTTETGQPCPGTMRAVIRDTGTIGRCTTCGHEAGTEDLELAVYGGTHAPLLTRAELATFIHTQFGKPITLAGVHKWVQRGIISPSHIDEDGREYFDRGQVAYILQRRGIR